MWWGIEWGGRAVALLTSYQDNLFLFYFPAVNILQKQVINHYIGLILFLFGLGMEYLKILVASLYRFIHFISKHQTYSTEFLPKKSYKEFSMDNENLFKQES